MGIRFVLVVLLAAALGEAQAVQVVPDRGIIPERFELENGMKVVLCSIGENGPITAQFYYDFSQLDDPPGLPQANRIVAKMRERAAFEGYAKDEATQLMNEIGIASSDGLPGCTLVKYGANANDLDLIFSIESARLEGVDTDDELLADARAWMVDVLDILERQSKPPVMTPAISAAVQYWAVGSEHVTLREPYSADASGRIDDLIKAAFAPNRATLVVFGEFEPVSTKDLIIEYFGGLRPPGLEVAASEPTGDTAQITWDLDETVVVLAYRAPDDAVSAAVMTVWGQLLAGVLTNDKEVRPLLSGITSSQLTYPAGPMPVIIFGRVRDGQDADAAVEALARRAEAIVQEMPRRLDFIQLGNTTRMFLGRYIVNSNSIARRSGSVGRQLNVKRQKALLIATEQFGSDIGLIEYAFGPDVHETASLVLDTDEARLIEMLTATINADNRSAVLIRPAAEKPAAEED